MVLILDHPEVNNINTWILKCRGSLPAVIRKTGEYVAMNIDVQCSPLVFKMEEGNHISKSVSGLPRLDNAMKQIYPRVFIKELIPATALTSVQ
jgi:hypothetical protein